VADTDEAAREAMWPAYRQMHDRIGGERGWPPITRAAFEHEVAHGSLYVGSPDTVARKIAATAGALGLARFDLKYSAGTLAHDRLLRCIELYGREVIPRVRALLAASGSSTAAASAPGRVTSPGGDQGARSPRRARAGAGDPPADAHRPRRATAARGGDVAYVTRSRGATGG
jgi:hypothetical protein